MFSQTRFKMLVLTNGKLMDVATPTGLELKRAFSSLRRSAFCQTDAFYRGVLLAVSKPLEA